MIQNEYQAYINQFRVTNFKHKLIQQAKLLSPSIGEIVEEITTTFKKNNGQTYGSYGVSKATNQGFEQFVKLPVNVQTQLIRILFPKISNQVLKGLELIEMGYPLNANERINFPTKLYAKATQRKAEWLSNLWSVLGDFRHDIRWVVNHANHNYFNNYFWVYFSATSLLITAGLELNDKDSNWILDTLIEIGKGEHERALFGTNVLTPLMASSRPEGWEFVGQMLLSAQRQEGLRQTILETVSICHPGAFRHMLNLIQEHNLIRFNSVIRAVDVWFGLGYDVTQTKEVQNVLVQFEQSLTNLNQAKRWALEGESKQVYTALIALGLNDISDATAVALEVFQQGEADQRLAAALFLRQLNDPTADAALFDLIADNDAHVQAVALKAFHNTDRSLPTGAFDYVESHLPRLPSKLKKLPERIWPWLKIESDPKAVGSLLYQTAAADKISLSKLFPHFKRLDFRGKKNLLEKIISQKSTWDAETRLMMVSIMGDLDRDIRSRATKGLRGVTLNEVEIMQLEGLMHRKAADLRRNTVNIISAQEAELVFDSSQRMLSSQKGLVRQAGLELLVELFTANRQPERCRQIVNTFRNSRDKLTATEDALLDRIPAEAAQDQQVLTLDDGLGLINHENRTKPHWPKKTNFMAYNKTMLSFILELDRFIEKNKNVEYTVTRSGDTTTHLLGNGDGFYIPFFPRPDLKLSKEDNLNNLPLKEMLIDWWEDVGKTILQSNLDLVRLNAIFDGYFFREADVYLNELTPSFKFFNSIKHKRKVQPIIDWYFYLYHPTKNIIDFVLDGVEHALSTILHSSKTKLWWGKSMEDVRNPRTVYAIEGWNHTANYFENLAPDLWEPHHHIRYWHLLRWLDEPQFDVSGFHPNSLTDRFRKLVGGPMTADKLQVHLLGKDSAYKYTQIPRRRPNFGILMSAYKHGGATEDDVLEHLIGSRKTDTLKDQYKKQDTTYYGHYYRGGFDSLAYISGRKPRQHRFNWEATIGFHPAAQAAIEKVRQRIIEVELTRGDLPTPASIPAKALIHSGGAENFVKLLKAFGKELFLRGYAYDGESKKAVFSHLIRATFPKEIDERDSPKNFVKLAKTADLPDKRWVEAALYAPQWAFHIENLLDWPDFADGVWWFHAHTKDTGWSVEKELREMWAAETNERTPLTADDLENGAVDVAWFKRVYQSLGTEKWKMLDAAAKYASTSGAHKRGQLYANAMLGVQDRNELINRLQKKRHQDSVRSLGLLPLPADSVERENELLKRYKILQDFLRGSRKFGSQRQASEKLAVKISMENLARSAGYPDPVRLQWAMERHAIADLAEGPVSVSADGVTVTLSINYLGEAEVDVIRELKDGSKKPLKNVPAKLKKNASIKTLTGRKADIRQQASRVRRSLEEAMIRGDHFSQPELATMFQHPVIKPMIKQLVFIRPDGAKGYPVMAGTELEGIEGAITRLTPSDQLRLAHPYDLLQDSWHIWQKECFHRERIQSFKQVFRELYIITPVEEEAGDKSRRYAGQEVNPRQAIRLFGQRGWINHPYEGIRKTWHDEKIIAHVDTLMGDFTPADVGGETLETVSFSRLGEWKRIPLIDVPPRLFSESMRDLDLVVSVAHLSGYDPEATESTAEMRANLARETVDLLNLTNVSFKERHILIDGQINNYSIHLSSGIIHQRPGGYVCIVPVHNSQRGRVFLPFVDKDPKTAEIIAKMIMLANDKKIKDPTILAQLVQK